MLDKAKTHSLLQEVRKRRALPAAELAQLVGVSRQTIYAIEDGSFVPNTTIALRLSRALEVRVEDLFSLGEPQETSDKLLRAEVLGEGKEVAVGEAVRLCRVHDRLFAVAIPALPAYLPPADAIVQKVSKGIVSVASFQDPAGYDKRFLLAGCDPALSLLTELLAFSGIEIVSIPCPSRMALRWLKDGRIHAAGSHLLDRATGEYNLPIIRRLFPKGSARVVTFALWEQGLIVARGNPKGIKSIDDLRRNDVTIVNRENGSGSRDLLDTGLRAAGIAAADVNGYGNIAQGHLPAAYAVAAHTADCCIATGSAARRFGLHFLSSAVERFDLTFSNASAELPAAKALLETLNRSTLRNKLRGIAGYDTQQTGVVQL